MFRKTVVILFLLNCLTTNIFSAEVLGLRSTNKPQKSKISQKEQSMEYFKEKREKENGAPFQFSIYNPKKDNLTKSPKRVKDKKGTATVKKELEFKVTAEEQLKHQLAHSIFLSKKCKKRKPSPNFNETDLNKNPLKKQRTSNEDEIEIAESKKENESDNTIIITEVIKKIFEPSSETIIIDDIDLSNITFHERPTFKNCKFNNCIFDETSFFGCKFIDVEFKDCSFIKSDFRIANLENVFFVNCNLYKTVFSSIDIKSCTFLNKVNFQCCAAQESGFNGTKMQDCLFEQTDLTDVFLMNTELTDTKFYHCKLEESCCLNIVCKNCKFNNVNWRNSNLTAAKIHNCSFEKCFLCFDPNCKYPKQENEIYPVLEQMSLSSNIFLNCKFLDETNQTYKFID